jgi:hypothetical protein
MGTFQIHHYISDPVIRVAFERAERDLPPAPAIPSPNRPTLTGGQEVAYA